jgi:hypothetical protein
MWEVKRMNTARIVVLTTADDAGDIAAYLANRSDNKPLPAEQVAQTAGHGRSPGDGGGPPAGIRVPSLTKTLK